MAAKLICHNGNAVRLFGLTNAERVRRMHEKQGSSTADDAVVEVDLDYAFDPAWFAHIVARPDRALVDGARVIIAHRSNSEGEIAESWDLATQPSIYNPTLRKTQSPFCLPLDTQNKDRIERESYSGAYKGVTDALTKYLWPRLAFHLTKFAAAVGLSPNMVTAVGAIACVLAAWLFAGGHYWSGTAAAFVFMVLDTVDGKLARCTMTSSWWGNIFDHGIDLIHPPFWYWFWAIGLSAWGLAYDPATFWWVQGILWGGYVAQRVIEGYFIYRHGFHIHVWRRFDSDFRLITARRNPNMVLLVGGLVFGRPDVGLVLVAVWTVVSLAVHMLQLMQAEIARRRSPMTSWLEDNST